MNTTADSTPANSPSRQLSAKEELDSRRSAVRVWVTYIAAAFVFGGGALMIAGLAILGGKEGYTTAKDLFMAILPVGTAVVTYWFAGRSAEKAGPDR